MVCNSSSGRWRSNIRHNDKEGDIYQETVGYLHSTCCFITEQCCLFLAENHATPESALKRCSTDNAIVAGIRPPPLEDAADATNPTNDSSR